MTYQVPAFAAMSVRVEVTTADGSPMTQRDRSHAVMRVMEFASSTCLPTANINITSMCSPKGRGMCDGVVIEINR